MSDDGITDPAVRAAQSALDQRGWFGHGNDEQLALTAAREALKPLRELHEDQRFHGRGPHSQEWWEGASYILAELAPLIYANDDRPE